MMSGRGEIPKISSGSSALPAAFASMSKISSFIDLALQRCRIGGVRRPCLFDCIAKQDVAALGARNGTADQHQITCLIDPGNLQVQCRDAFLTKMASHLLVLKSLTWILTVTR